MHKKDLFQTMLGLIQSMTIQVLLLNKEFEGIENIDFGFRKRIFEGYDYRGYVRSIGDKILPGILYHMEDELGLYYSVFRFPEDLQEELNVHVLCIGPMTVYSDTQEAVSHFLNCHSIPEKMHFDFYEFYSEIPMHPSQSFWDSALLYFLQSICEKPMKSQIIPDLKMERLSPAYVDYFIPRNASHTAESVKKRYRLEDKILTCVLDGRLDEALEIQKHMMKHRLYPQSGNELRDRKNLLLNFNTLLRKTVQSAGIHPLHIETISFDNIKKIESCHSQEELDLVSSDLPGSYHMLIQSYSSGKYSYLVQTCINYIEFHYAEKLTLPDLARVCFSSPTYLAAIFKKETGQTLTSYINGLRIQQAKVLLNSTGLSVQEAAADCGITDANYFSRLFKKYTGQTPREYRTILRQKEEMLKKNQEGWIPL